MRLIHRLTLRLSMAALLVIAIWSVAFYLAIINEIYDELDDTLYDYAELVEKRVSEGADADMIRDDEAILASFEKDDLIESILQLILILMGALVLSFGVISLFCVSSTTKPLHRLLKWLDAYKPGERNDILENPTSITEFRQLNEAVSQMTERVENYGRQQNLFISNASHEMQTPLAIGIGRLESMLEEEQLSESQAQELVKVLHSLSGLSHLNKSLLMLSRIDNGQYADDKPLDLYDMLCCHLPDFEEMFANKSIRTECKAEGSLVVNMDMTLSRILIFNLLKNAFVHSPSGGTITVYSLSDSLTISNTADGGSLPADEIFQPFYHSAANSQSTGLGLPLALAVAKRYGLRLEYSYDGRDHIFKLLRP